MFLKFLGRIIPNRWHKTISTKQKKSVTNIGVGAIFVMFPRTFFLYQILHYNQLYNSCQHLVCLSYDAIMLKIALSPCVTLTSLRAHIQDVSKNSIKVYKSSLAR